MIYSVILVKGTFLLISVRRPPPAPPVRSLRSEVYPGKVGVLEEACSFVSWMRATCTSRRCRKSFSSIFLFNIPFAFHCRKFIVLFLLLLDVWFGARVGGKPGPVVGGLGGVWFVLIVWFGTAGAPRAGGALIGVDWGGRLF